MTARLRVEPCNGAGISFCVMRSPCSLRRLATSRLLRVMALLGWLLMTVSLPATGAMPGDAPQPHAANMVTMAMDHAMGMNDMATGGHHADHCCGDTAHSACHCEAMCASVLFPTVPTLLGPVRLADVHLPVRDVDAPKPNLIPPLRPPAV